MTTKIDSKIISYSVAEKTEDNGAAETTAQALQNAANTSIPDAAAEEESTSNVIHMHEKVKRPDVLIGSTYKIKTPLSDHALYVTVNDIVLNQGTKHELRRPFEIFINSKNMDHFQWIVALTRIMSAVFRKGGDVIFLVEELHSVFDPRGGYFKKGGKFVPSLVAELGNVIEEHLISIGMLKSKELDQHQQKLVDEKRAQYEAKQHKVDGDIASSDFPEGAQLCMKCNTQAMIIMDGCLTCLNCGESKCG
ncbi:MAG: NrdJb [Gammaproteobacteria bacterium]|nr:MAG: NrdJb [Gammaproteobacteria bacterium]